MELDEIYENIFKEDTLKKDNFVRVLQKINDNSYLVQGITTSTIQEIEFDVDNPPRTQSEVDSESIVDGYKETEVEKARKELQSKVLTRQQKKDDETIMEMLAHPHESLIKLHESNRRNDYFSGILCTEVYTQNLQLQVGFEATKQGFERYCNEYLHLDYRKAMNLIQANKFVAMYGITSEAYAKIGYLKMVELQRKVPEGMTVKEIDEYLDDASTLSTKNLRAKLRSNLSEDNVRATKTKWTFTTLEQDTELLNLSIQEYRTLNDTPEVNEMSDAEVMIRIVADFAINQDSKKVEFNEETLEATANIYGKTLVPLDEVDTEVHEQEVAPMITEQF